MSAQSQKEKCAGRKEDQSGARRLRHSARPWFTKKVDERGKLSDFEWRAAVSVRPPFFCPEVVPFKKLTNPFLKCCQYVTRGFPPKQLCWPSLTHTNSNTYTYRDIDATSSTGQGEKLEKESKKSKPSGGRAAQEEGPASPPREGPRSTRGQRATDQRR